MSVIEEFEKMHINEVIKIARDKENPKSNIANDYIIEKYKNVIKRLIMKRRYYMPGYDYNDMMQEGMFGVYKSIKDFKEEAGEYEVFLRVCVERQLISALKTTTRKKHIPLNESLHLDKTLPENDNMSMMDLIAAKEGVQNGLSFDYITPEEQLMLKEDIAIKKAQIYKEMSKRETQVYELYIQGKSYKEMEEELGESSPKAIDNAVQRFKRKIDKIKENELQNDWNERDIN